MCWVAIGVAMVVQFAVIPLREWDSGFGYWPSFPGPKDWTFPASGFAQLLWDVAIALTALVLASTFGHSRTSASVTRLVDWATGAAAAAVVVRLALYISFTNDWIGRDVPLDWLVTTWAPLAVQPVFIRVVWRTLPTRRGTGLTFTDYLLILCAFGFSVLNTISLTRLFESATFANTLSLIGFSLLAGFWPAAVLWLIGRPRIPASQQLADLVALAAVVAYPALVASVYLADRDSGLGIEVLTLLWFPVIAYLSHAASPTAEPSPPLRDGLVTAGA